MTQFVSYATISAMNMVTLPKPAGASGVEKLVQESVSQWSGVCQQFLDWQRAEVLGREPSKEELQAHRDALKWMLRFARAVYASAADPDYPNPEVADELRGRVIQLEHSWRMIQEPMPDAEAEALLHNVFPE